MLTKGEWKIDPEYPDQITTEYGVVCTNIENKDDANLIKASPNMHRELELVLGTLDCIEGRHLPRGKSEHHKRVWNDCELTRNRIKTVLASAKAVKEVLGDEDGGWEQERQMMEGGN